MDRKRSADDQESARGATSPSPDWISHRRDGSGCIRADLRSYDFLVRLSGDEFICAHPGQYADRVEVFMSALLAKGTSGAKMTVGLATRRPGDSLAELVDRADQAMLADRRSSNVRGQDN